MNKYVQPLPFADPALAARKIFKLSHAFQPPAAFALPSRLICPSVWFSEIVSSPAKKNISLYQKRKSGVGFVHPAAHTEGRFAIVTKRGAGGDGRW